MNKENIEKVYKYLYDRATYHFIRNHGRNNVFVDLMCFSMSSMETGVSVWRDAEEFDTMAIEFYSTIKVILVYIFLFVKLIICYYTIHG